MKIRMIRIHGAEEPRVTVGENANSLEPSEYGVTADMKNNALHFYPWPSIMLCVLERPEEPTGKKAKG